MRILMINSVCGIKSTGRICTDLATELEKQGHTVKIAYGRDNVPDTFIDSAVKIGDKKDTVLHAVEARLFDGDGKGSRSATKEFIEWVEKFDPDIIHLHNIHGYYINTELLFSYINRKKKKVIWTLHDMWAFTGHSCTCDLYKCEKWKSQCQKCPAIHDYPKSYIDRSRTNFKKKKQMFSQVSDLTIVTPSHWLAGLVKESFLGDASIKVIPNGVDTSQFKPLKNDFRELYKLENKIVLLGCSSVWEESKGLFDFYKLTDLLDDRFRIVLVGLSEEQMNDLPDKIVGIRRTNSVKELVYIYNAADVFMNLTYRDNYPTTNIEALACGTPVITYDTGGSKECLDADTGKIFPQGDLSSIADFLKNEYSPQMFTVKPNEKNSKEFFGATYLNLFTSIYKCQKTDDQKIGGGVL